MVTCLTHKDGAGRREGRGWGGGLGGGGGRDPTVVSFSHVDSKEPLIRTAIRHYFPDFLFTFVEGIVCPANKIEIDT